MADLEVDPSQVHTIEVDPSKVSAMPAGPQQPQGSAAGRFLGGLWDTTVGGLKDTGLAVLDLARQAVSGQAAIDPNSRGGRAVIGLVQSHIDQAEKAKQALKQGNYSEAVGHTLATIVPMVGPAAAHAGERIGEGDVAGGLGEATGLVGMTAAPTAVKAARGKLPAEVKTGPIVESKLNPVEQSAVDFLKEQNVPLRVGTQTGNKFVRSFESTTQHSPIGAPVAEDLSRATEQGLQRTAGNLAYEQSAVPATPESAGQAVKATLGKNIEQLGLKSDAAYKDAWQARDNPAFSEELPVRTERTFLLDNDGRPTGEIAEKAVTKRVNMPVDVRQIKEALKPVFDEMQWMPAADRNSSAGYQAVKNILEGDDYIPAWQAERGLSGLKAMARTTTQSGVRNASQGIGASIIPGLQELVDSAVAKTGDSAIRGLQKGRALHASKMEVAEIADQLRDEPVQNFGKLVWQNDTGIDFLRKIADQAPDVMPEVGRAFVDQLFDKATREGGFAKARSILTQWQTLGPETKKILFPNPAVRSGLDKFFKGAEMVGQTPNPSGTALVTAAKEAASLNPFRWFAGYAGSKLLFTPRGSAILMDGLKIPLGGPGSAAAETALQQLAKQYAATAAASTKE